MTKLIRPLVAGLLVVLPAVLTLVLLGWIGNLIYGFVGPGSLVGRGLVAIGIGFVSSQIVAYLIGIGITIAAIYLLGLVVETRIRQRVGALLDMLLNRIPLVGNVYDLAKRFVAIVDRKEGDTIASMSPLVLFRRRGQRGGAGALSAAAAGHDRRRALHRGAGALGAGARWWGAGLCANQMGQARRDRRRRADQRLRLDGHDSAAGARSASFTEDK
jgi:hypothetical protein